MNGVDGAYTVTIHVDTGSVANASVGHVWVEIGMPNGSTSTYGYNPEEPAPINDVQVWDESHREEADWSSDTIPISEAQFIDIVDYLNETISEPGTYVVGINDCVQFVHDVMEQAGLPFPSATFPRLPLSIWNEIKQFIEETMDNFNDAINCPPGDPLALDLDGDGIETVAADGYNGAMFDLDADGVRTATSWVSGDDGILVWDKNLDGQVNDGAELFGHVGDVAHMNQLSDVDSNADGQINSSDIEFANLRVWRDLNGDGQSESGELFTLVDLGIASLNATLTSQNIDLGDGNTQLSSGSFTYADGSIGEMADVGLQEQTIYSDFTDTIPLTNEALELPGLSGLGMVRDLREAVSLDDSGQLASMLSQYQENRGQMQC